jgi:hypothetical protein
MNEQKGGQGKRQKAKFIGVHKRPKEPVDYGVTKDQIYEILDKASQPVGESKEKTNGKK